LRLSPAFRRRRLRHVAFDAPPAFTELSPADDIAADIDALMLAPLTRRRHLEAKYAIAVSRAAPIAATLT